METVFSHHSKVEFVRRAKNHGYDVNLFYIYLSTGFLHQARVIQRVEQGGHGVPFHKIEPRVERLRENVKEALPLCNFVAFYDNSDSDHPFQPVLAIRNGEVHRHQAPLPAWARDFV